MDEKHIMQLLHAARGVDELERDLGAAPSPSLRLATINARRVWGLRIAAALALASAGVALVTWHNHHPSSQPGGSLASGSQSHQPQAPLTQTNTTNGAAPSAASHALPKNPPRDLVTQGSVVLAIADDGTGEPTCVNWSSTALAGRSLHELRDEDLRQMGLALSCTGDTRRMLVVGIQGPKSALPLTEEGAVDVAKCMLATPPCEGSVFNAKACASSACLSQEVQVRVKSVAMR